jgi:hypothetical protein
MVAYFLIRIRSLAATFVRFAQILNRLLMLRSPQGLPNSRSAQAKFFEKSIGLTLFRRDGRIAADLHYCQRYSYRCVALGEPAMSKDRLAKPVGVPLASAFAPQTGDWIEFAQAFLLCFALPLSAVYAQTPQSTPQRPMQSGQQIQPAQPNQPAPRPPRNWGPNGAGECGLGIGYEPNAGHGASAAAS